MFFKVSSVMALCWPKFTNSSNTIHSTKACPFSVSDHYLMTTSTMYNMSQSINEEPDTTPDEDCRSFRSLNFLNENINWDALSQELGNHDWQLEFRKQSSAEMMTSFSSVCLDISSKWIPTRLPKQSQQKIPNQRRSLIKQIWAQTCLNPKATDFKTKGTPEIPLRPQTQCRSKSHWKNQDKS